MFIEYLLCILDIYSTCMLNIYNSNRNIQYMCIINIQYTCIINIQYTCIINIQYICIINIQYTSSLHVLLIHTKMYYMLFSYQTGYIMWHWLKHGWQNIMLHWINGIIQNNKCIFTKLNAVFILKTAAWCIFPSAAPQGI
jgi:hypothetical protein